MTLESWRRSEEPQRAPAGLGQVLQNTHSRSPPFGEKRPLETNLVVGLRPGHGPTAEVAACRSAAELLPISSLTVAYRILTCTKDVAGHTVSASCSCSGLQPERRTCNGCAAGVLAASISLVGHQQRRPLDTWAGDDVEEAIEAVTKHGVRGQLAKAVGLCSAKQRADRLRRR